MQYLFVAFADQLIELPAALQHAVLHLPKLQMQEQHLSYLFFYEGQEPVECYVAQDSAEVHPSLQV
ncbi:hypothetical protein H0H87_001356, partial [Tephrocybe sp. NHM501043]